MTPKPVQTFICFHFRSNPNRNQKRLVFPRILPMKTEVWLGPESNRRHVDFQSTALPTELPSRDCRRSCGVSWGSHYAAIPLQGKHSAYRSGQNRCLLQNSNTVRISQQDLPSKKSRRVYEILRRFLADIPGAGVNRQPRDQPCVNHPTARSKYVRAHRV